MLFKSLPDKLSPVFYQQRLNVLIQYCSAIINTVRADQPVKGWLP